MGRQRQRQGLRGHWESQELDEAGGVLPWILGNMLTLDLHWLQVIGCGRGNTDSLPPLGGSLCRAPALPLTRHSPRPHWIHTSAAVSLPMRSPLLGPGLLHLCPSAPIEVAPGGEEPCRARRFN